MSVYLCSAAVGGGSQREGLLMCWHGLVAGTAGSSAHCAVDSPRSHSPRPL